MISRELLQHRRWTMAIGYRPDWKSMVAIVDSHLEALDEIDRLLDLRLMERMREERR